MLVKSIGNQMTSINNRKKANNSIPFGMELIPGSNIKKALSGRYVSDSTINQIKMLKERFASFGQSDRKAFLDFEKNAFESYFQFVLKVFGKDKEEVRTIPLNKDIKSVAELFETVDEPLIGKLLFYGEELGEKMDAHLI